MRIRFKPARAFEENIGEVQIKYQGNSDDGQNAFVSIEGPLGTIDRSALSA
jgi:hypothetical protein